MRDAGVKTAAISVYVVVAFAVSYCVVVALWWTADDKICERAGGKYVHSCKPVELMFTDNNGNTQIMTDEACAYYCAVPVKH